MISRQQFENFNKKFDIVSAFLDHEGETLLLHRQDHKPQGNTWAMVAGKVEKEEDLAAALIREIKEEIGLQVHREDCKYFENYFIRYPEYDYVYHVFHLPLQEKPLLSLNRDEHKDFKWIKPIEALGLNLITYEDVCIKYFYNLD